MNQKMQDVLKGFIISKPKEGTRAVFIGKAIPFFKGGGNVNIICAKCNLPLASNISKGQLKNIVIKCPNCDAYNDIQESIYHRG